MTAPATLRRALGRWDLVAIGVNQVIGSGIFLLPSRVTEQVGAWAVVAFALAGLASLLVALCFAEAGSRFEVTGGPYVYTRAAFGRLVGFEVGWMQWVTRLTSWAGVANGIPLALGFYIPAMTSGLPHVLFIVGIFGTLAFINLLGVRQAAWAINFFTVSKLLPLGVFILVGLFFMQAEPFTTYQCLSIAALSSTHHALHRHHVLHHARLHAHHLAAHLHVLTDQSGHDVGNGIDFLRALCRVHLRDQRLELFVHRLHLLHHLLTLGHHLGHLALHRAHLSAWLSLLCLDLRQHEATDQNGPRKD